MYASVLADYSVFWQFNSNQTPSVVPVFGESSVRV